MMKRAGLSNVAVVDMKSGVVLSVAVDNTRGRVRPCDMIHEDDWEDCLNELEIECDKTLDQAEKVMSDRRTTAVTRKRRVEALLVKHESLKKEIGDWYLVPRRT